MTQDNGHTAGPWVFSFESVDPEWAIVSTTGGAIIANVNADHRQEANARLIAAAPEQLGIIKEFIEWVDRFTGTLPEAQSDALFDIYRRARATYRNVDQVAHDASREAALLQARGEAG